MNIEPTSLARFGAWMQLGVIGSTILFWSLGVTAAFVASLAAYLIITITGIVGISRTESGLVGAVIYPFILPGFIPLYYFATR